ncbi:MAG TPA: hypothetical protein DIS75_03305 [Chryseobacterium sp.]|nr:hypothetical protein [Chryseobacterium sp.]
MRGEVQIEKQKKKSAHAFHSAIFFKLAVLKKHSLRLVGLEHFVLREPAFRQYFLNAQIIGCQKNNQKKL